MRYEKARGRWKRGIGLDPFYKGDEYQESLLWPFEAYLKTHGVIPTAVVGSRTLILMENPVIRGTRSLPRRDVPIKPPRNTSHCGVGDVGSRWTEPRCKGTTHEDCQQIRSIPYEDHPADPDIVYVFNKPLWRIRRRNPPCNTEDNTARRTHRH